MKIKALCMAMIPVAEHPGSAAGHAGETGMARTRCRVAGVLQRLVRRQYAVSPHFPSLKPLKQDIRGHHREC
jgi:hypothetical protein